jgi:hypothetical protein
MSLIKQKGSPFWYSSININGVTYRKSLKTTNKKLAQQLDYAHRDEILKKVHLDSGDITITQAFDTYFRDRSAPCIDIKKWSEVIDMKKNISELNQRDIQNLHEQLLSQMKQSSASYNMAILRAVYRWAKSQNYKCRELNFPKTVTSKKRIRIMSLAEEDALLKALEQKCQTALKTFQ